MDYVNYGYQKLRGIERKHYLLRKRGCKCENCGYNKNMAALEFHHLYDKEFRLDARKLSNSSLEQIEKEFEKCLVLCSNCHKEEHNLKHDFNNIENLKQEILGEIEANENYLKEITEKPKKPKKPKNTCCDCGNEVDRQAKRCEECSKKLRLKNAKIPDNPQQLEKDIQELGIMGCSKKYNVSHTTIRRWSGRKKDCSIPDYIKNK